MPKLNIMVDTDPGEDTELAYAGRVNCYVEPGAKDGSRAPTVKGCPGLVQFVDTGDAGMRGQLEVDGVLYAVMEAAVFKITSDGTKTNIGSIPGRGPVMMVRNQASPVQIGLVNNQGRYYVIESDVIDLVATGDLTDDGSVINSICSLDQRFILGTDRGKMWQTDLLQASTIDGLGFATAEADPDGLIRVVAFNGRLLPFGVKTTENWSSNGAGTGFSFSRVSAGYIKVGLSAKWSYLELGGTVYFIGNDAGKDHKVYRLEGYSPTPVSNAYVERLIGSDSAISDIEAYSYSTAGNTFYGLQGSGWTVEMSLDTGFWHDRRSYNRPQWRGRYAVSAFNEILFGELETGKIFKVQENMYTEDGDPIIREVRAQPIETIGDEVPLNELEFPMVTGQAANYTDEPMLMVDWTKDGSATWSGERHLSLGKKGERVKRVYTTRMGSTERNGNLVFRMRLSENHPFEMQSTDLRAG